MKLFFDTETTGLPKDYKASPKKWDQFPRMVQLAWIVTDDDLNTIVEHDYIIKPEGWEIPKDSSDIHGISYEKAMAEGDSSFTVMETFITDLNRSDELIAHNISFDEKIIAAEMYRLNMIGLSKNRPSKICTMHSSTEFCKIPSPYKKGTYKWPRLNELHLKLFNEEFDGAHNALNDIRATVRCYKELKELNVL
jgi:DNA polymerase-3 subunit epsilon